MIINIISHGIQNVKFLFLRVVSFCCNTQTDEEEASKINPSLFAFRPRPEAGSVRAHKAAVDDEHQKWAEPVICNEKL